MHQKEKDRSKNRLCKRALTFRALALRQRKTWKLFLSDEGPMLETLDHTIRIGSTPTFLYFDLYLHSAYAAHYVYVYLAIISLH